MKKTILAVVVLFLSGCSSANLDDVRANACDKWKSVGYICVGYEGFQWGKWVGGSYGGALVWHTLRREEAPGIIYTGYVQKWGNEYHAYGPNAVDAFKPK